LVAEPLVKKTRHGFNPTKRNEKIIGRPEIPRLVIKARQWEPFGQNADDREMLTVQSQAATKVISAAE
jgi:hypothetical protein